MILSTRGQGQGTRFLTEALSSPMCLMGTSLGTRGQLSPNEMGGEPCHRSYSEGSCFRPSPIASAFRVAATARSVCGPLRFSTSCVSARAVQRHETTAKPSVLAALNPRRATTARTTGASGNCGGVGVCGGVEFVSPTPPAGPRSRPVKNFFNTDRAQGKTA